MNEINKEAIKFFQLINPQVKIDIDKISEKEMKKFISYQNGLNSPPVKTFNKPFIQLDKSEK